ncbi:MAG: prephenate dehydrogenase/arogenate dehydrogenase family protein [Vicinamibacterales bacterium]
MFRTIGIVGLGLIGGSVALAVRDAWPAVRIVAVDTPAVLAVARSAAAIDDGSEDLDVVGGADVIVLAAPVRQNIAVLRRLAGRVNPAAIITDVGSTKRDIVAAAADLRAGATFVAGHPVAGAARGGFEHARADLFRNRPWLFTPVSSTPVTAVERMKSFASALGAMVGVMTLDEHDRVFAFVSHMPQLAVSALMAVAGNAVGAEGLALSGRGLLDTTRLASSPSDIWQDVAAVNEDQIASALDALIAALQSLRTDLSSGERLAEVFADAARWREVLVSRSTL